MGAGGAVRMIVADDDRPRTALLTEALRAADGPGRPVALTDAAVLVASPRAARSAAVDERLAAWVGAHSAASVLVVLLDGELAWDDEVGAFDASATSALSPAAQRCFVTRPLWLEARTGITTQVVGRIVSALTAADRRPPTSRRRRATVALIGAAALAVLAVVTIGDVLVGDDTGTAPPPTTTDLSPTPTDVSPTPDSSGSSVPWWLVLTAGLVIGVAAGAWVTSRRHRRARRAVQAPTPSEFPVHDVATGERSRATQSPPARASVFISHDFDADHELARRFADDLRGDSNVWIAPESIEPGESWLMSIDRGLRACTVFLALLSHSALASPWVLKELQAAMELETRQKLRLVPVRLDDCDIPILLRTYQTLQFASGYSAVLDQLRRLVRSTG